MNFFNFNESKSWKDDSLECNKQENTQKCKAYLFKDSTRIEKHKATRNTELTRAPSTSARAQPKVFLDHFFGDICIGKRRGYNPEQKQG